MKRVFISLLVALSFVLVLNFTRELEFGGQGEVSGAQSSGSGFTAGSELNEKSLLTQKRPLAVVPGDSVAGSFSPAYERHKAFIEQGGLSTHDLLLGLNILQEERRDLGDGSFERVRLVEAKIGQYPIWRTQEIVVPNLEGEDVVIGRQIVQGDHLVVPTHTGSHVMQRVEELGLTIRRIPPHSPFILVETPELELDGVVALQELFASNNLQADFDLIGLPRNTTPNDPRWNSEKWHLENMELPAAWDITTGSDEVVVGIFDSGFNINHEDLQANIWVNSGEIPGNGIDDDLNGYIDDVNAWHWGNGNNDVTSEANEHGTPAAGNVGAVGNNGVGFVGVNWNVKILTGGTSYNFSQMIEFLDYCTFMKIHRNVNIVVTNHSYGGYTSTSISTFNGWNGSSWSYADSNKRAIARAREAGILFVGSAGNDGIDHDTQQRSAPDGYDLSDAPSVGDWDPSIAVAAADNNDNFVVFSGTNSFGGQRGSDYGLTMVDIAAPGRVLYSTRKNGGYGEFSGTSFAAPLTAGVLALMHSANPSVGGEGLKDILLTTGDYKPFSDDPNLNIPRRTVTDSHVNAHAAVLKALSYPTITNLFPAENQEFFPLNTTIPIRVGANDSDGSIAEVRFYATLVPAGPDGLISSGSDVLIGTDNDGSDGYGVNWLPAAEGMYRLAVEAEDDAGQVSRQSLFLNYGSIIIDDEHPAITSSRATPSDAYGGSMARVSVTGAHAETIGFDLPSSGNWTVYGWWGNASSGFHATNAAYEFTPSTGSTQSITGVNWTQNYGQWNELGTLNLDAGWLEVEISKDAGSGSARWIFDALKLTQQAPASPPVSVIASDSTATEAGTTTGEFLLYRGGSTGALDVTVSISGTATSGVDYSALSTTVSFADGESTKSVFVTPIDDGFSELEETVVLTIEPGASYEVGGNSSATVTLISDEAEPELLLESPSSGAVQLGSASQELRLKAVISNGFTLSGGASVQWTQTAGPVGATLSDANELQTDLTFSADGVYAFELTVSDGAFVKTISADVIVGAVDLSSQLLAHYELEEANGSAAAADSSGNNYSASTSGDADFGSKGGRSGVALFDGDSDVMTSTTGGSGISGGTALSVALWFNADAIGSDSGLVEIRTSDESNEVFYLRFDDVGWSGVNGSSDNHIHGFLRTSGNQNTQLYSSNYLQVADEWVHLTYVWEQNAYPKLYVNGVEDTPTAAGYYDGSSFIAQPSNGTINSAGSLSLGKRGSEFWDGALDDVRVYTRALSVDEITVLASGVINSAPSIALSVPSTGAANTPLNFDATVTDDGLPTPSALSYEWSRVSGPGSVNFGTATSEDTSATFTTDGAYTIRLSVSDGEATSIQDTVITISGGGTVTAPSITMEPVGGAHEYGSEVELTVAATGDDLSYQWFTVEGETETAIVDATSAAFTKPALETDTDYFVRVSNSAGSVDSNVVSLTVLWRFNEHILSSWIASAPAELDLDVDARGFGDSANRLMANGMIYALGINSLDPGAAQGKLPTFEIIDGAGEQYLQLQLRRREGGTGQIFTNEGYVADGVVYIVEMSDDLTGAWSTGAAYFQLVGEPSSNGDGTETVIVRLNTSIQSGAGEKRFLRLRSIEAP